MSKYSQAYLMFSEGKSPTDVAVALDMNEPEVTQLYRENWTLRQIYHLNTIYLETQGELGVFVKLYMLSKEAGLNIERVINILKLADNNLPHLEIGLTSKLELKFLESKKENSIKIVQDYENQIRGLGKSLDDYCEPGI